MNRIRYGVSIVFIFLFCSSNLQDIHERIKHTVFCPTVLFVVAAVLNLQAEELEDVKFS